MVIVLVLQPFFFQSWLKFVSIFEMRIQIIECELHIDKSLTFKY